MIERVQFITNDFNRTHWENTELACKGGIKWVQLRVKDADEETLRITAEKTQDVCVKYGANMIINDHIELAKTLLVDGVHLGLNDTPITQAKSFLGDSFIVGGTANTFEDVAAHYHAQADYVGLGPFRFTETKKKLSPILGLEGYRAILHYMQKEGINIPIVAIGGIQLTDIQPLREIGLFGIAISSLITAAEDPRATSEKILELIH